MTVARVRFAGATQRRLAYAIALISLVLSAVSFLLIAMTPDLEVLSGWGFVGYDAVFALVYVTVGLLILYRRPGNKIGWLFLVSALLSGLQTVMTSYAGYALRTGLPNGSLALWISGWIWIPAVALIILTLLLYPDGMLPSQGWRWVVLGLIPVATAVTLLWALATPEDAASPDPFAVDPLGLAPDHPLRVLAGPSLLLLTVWFLIAAASLVARMRRGDTVVRQQVKWIAFAGALVGTTLGLSVMSTLYTADPMLAKLTQLISVGAILLIPLAAAVAILRYRLYDIDVLINRTLVYGLVSAVLIGAYAAGVVLFQSLLRPFTAGSELAIAVSTLLVAALFHPVRARVQAAVDRRFYRARYDAERTLDAFGARLRDEVDLDSVRADLVDAVYETVRPAHASVWLRR